MDEGQESNCPCDSVCRWFGLLMLSSRSRWSREQWCRWGGPSPASRSRRSACRCPAGRPGSPSTSGPGTATGGASPSASGSAAPPPPPPGAWRQTDRLSVISYIDATTCYRHDILTSVTSNTQLPRQEMNPGRGLRLERRHESTAEQPLANIQPSSSSQLLIYLILLHDVRQGRRARNWCNKRPFIELWYLSRKAFNNIYKGKKIKLK